MKKIYTIVVAALFSATVFAQDTATNELSSSHS